MTREQLAFIFSLYLGQKQILCDVAPVYLHPFQPYQPAFSISTCQLDSRWGRNWGRDPAVALGAVQSGFTEEWPVSTREIHHKVRSVWGYVVTKNSEVIETWGATSH